jgi:hypothetical protein
MLERTRRDPAQRATLVHENLLQRDDAPRVCIHTPGRPEHGAPGRGQRRRPASSNWPRLQQRAARGGGGSPLLRTLRVDAKRRRAVWRTRRRILLTIVVRPTPP